jgi:hypothetical protein
LLEAIQMVIAGYQVHQLLIPPASAEQSLNVRGLDHPGNKVGVLSSH